MARTGVQITSTLTDTDQDWQYVVVFWLDRQMFAVPIESVVKISARTALAPITHADPSVVGVIEIAGRAALAVSLQNSPDAVVRAVSHAPVLVVQIGEAIIAMVVDKLAGVVRVPRWQIRPIGARLPGTIVHTPLGIALLLNLARVFTADQIQTLTRPPCGMPIPVTAATPEAQI